MSSPASIFKFLFRKTLLFAALGILFLISAVVSANAQNVTVNPGNGSYPTLKAAFDAINSGTHTGTVTVTIVNNTSENATAVLNASGSGSASYGSVLISPNGARTISGSIAGSALIDFNGADNVTIDGLNSGGNFLFISNTSTSSVSGTSTIRFINDATGNTITRATIFGASTMSTTTNGGTIFFSTAANGGNGNDNNTISSCDIGPINSDLPTKAIYGNGSTVSTAAYNNGISISNNNIYDFFNPAATSNGIYVSNGNTDWTISGNRFYQTATRTQTTGAIHSAIQIAGSTGNNNHLITGNVIGFSGMTGTGTYNFAGVGTGSKFLPIYFSSAGTTAASSIQGNTITAINLSGTIGGTGTTASFVGISIASGIVNIGNVVGNAVGSITAAGAISIANNNASASEIYGIYYAPTTVSSISNNVVGGIASTNAGGGSVVAMGIRASTANAINVNFQNNIIGSPAAPINNNTVSTASRVVGIYSQSCIPNATGNTVRSLTTNAANTGTGTSASVIGIWIDGAGEGAIVSQNTVHSLSNSSATTAAAVSGIQYAGASAGTNSVARNFVHSLSVAGSGSVLRGINVTSGAGNFQNNMVRLGIDASGASLTGGFDIIGINDTVGTNNYYHNSVYIGGSAGATAQRTFALSSSVTLNSRSFLNNVFANDRTISGGGGGNFAAQFGGTTPNPAGLNSNYNVYYSDDSATIIRNGGTSYNLSGWKTASGNQDANSLQVGISQINFANPAGTAANVNLHVQNPTVIEGAGISVASVADDFDGDVRANLSPADIGADAGNFAPLDLTAPVISYTPLSNTAETTNRVVGAAISDATGVAAGGGSPRIYFRKNAGAYSSTQCSLTGGTAQNGNYNCTIDYSLIGGASGGNAIDYFIIAQDTVGNIGSNPGGVIAASVSTVTTPPQPRTYSIIAAIPSTVTVGAGGTYTSLTNPGGLFEALNTGVLNSNLTVEITSDLTAETGAVALNQLNETGAGGYTVTIKPSGAARLIRGTASAPHIIKLDGADRIIIDGSLSGGTDRSLTIENPNTGNNSGVIFIGSLGTGAGATGNTVKNTIIRGGSVGTVSNLTYAFFVGHSNGSAAGADNDNLTIQNNKIEKARTAIQAFGEAGGVLDNLAVTDNIIGDDAAANTIGRIGINVAQLNNASILRNTIKNISLSGDTANPVGISASAATGVTIRQNSINGVQSGGTNPFGMLLGTGFLNSVVSRNNVSNIAYTGSGGFGGKGIDINTGSTTSNVTFDNNFVSEIKGDGWNSLAGDSIVGFRIGGMTGGINLYFNSINLGSESFNGNPSGTLSAAFYISVTATGLNVRNNIFATNLDNASTTSDKSYAFYSAAPNPAFLSINHNNYFTPTSTAAGPQVLGFLGSDLLTLNDIKTATGQDADSKSVNPLFVSATDLHLENSSSLRNMGAPVAGITVDIDGDLRHPATPDIGADQVVAFVYPTMQFNSAIYSASEGTSAAITVTRSGDTTLASTIAYAASDGTATGGAACGAGVDYIAASGTLNFAVGEASKTFNIQICSDLQVKGTETVNLTLSSPVNGVLATPSTAILNISDVAPMFGQLRFSSATYSVGEAGPTATITVTRNNGSEGAVGVSYATANGTATGGASCATAGVDFVNTSGTLSFAAGETSKTFTVAVCDDNVFEGDETINLTLSNPTGGATIGTPASAVLTIVDNDTPPSLQLSSATYSVGEGGGTVTITVNRTGASANSVGVNFATSNGTAAGGAACGAGVDYVNASGTLNFAPADTSKTFTVSVCDDSLNENDETFNVTLSSPTGGAVLGTPAAAVVTITDNDSQPVLQLSSATYSVNEGAGTLTVTVNRTGASGNAVGVSYATSGGTATGGGSCGTTGVDYVSINGALTFAAGDTSKTFTVTICDDSVYEGDETFNITLSNPTGGAALGTPVSAVATIVENEPAPQFIQFGSATYTGAEGSLVNITVTRTGDAGAVGVSYAASNGTATGGESCKSGNNDYVSSSGTLSFAAGEASKVISIQLCADFIIEQNETVNLTLSNPTGGASLGTPAAAVLTITDNTRMVKNDFDGDGISDVAVFRPSNSTWYILPSQTGAFIMFQFGMSGDKPVPADYDGDGKTDIAVYRPTNSTWYVHYSRTNTLGIEDWEGLGSDVLVPADYDGDGKADYAGWQHSRGRWFIKLSSNGLYRIEVFGMNGDAPLVGDYDGDGKADLTVIRAASAPGSQVTIYSRNSSNNNLAVTFWGVRGDTFVSGDYDGDRKDDFAVFRGGIWYIRRSNNGSLLTQPWGLSGDAPVGGDFDGDGLADYTVWRSAAGAVFYTNLQTGAFLPQYWGTTGDVALSNAVIY